LTGSVVLRGRKTFFFVNKKETKKLWLSGFVPVKTPVPQIRKVFCFFFSKKKSLPHRIELTDRAVIGHTGWYNVNRK